MRRLILSLFAAMILTPCTGAQPGSFTYQGRLLDGSGVPVTSSTAIRIRLYRGGDANTADSGTLIYQETVSVTPDATGIFSHRVGATPDIGFSISAPIFQTATPIYLQINVPFDGAALLPRTQLLSVPYAQVATQLTRVNEVHSVPVLSGRSLQNANVTVSDDRSDVYGLILPPVGTSLAVGDAELPVTWNAGTPTLEVTAEVYGQDLPIDPGSRTAVLSFRLRNLEGTGAITFEGSHTFTTRGPETFTLPVAAQSGTFSAGDAATWSYGRRGDVPADTLSGDVLLLHAQVLLNVAR